MSDAMTKNPAMESAEAQMEAARSRMQRAGDAANKTLDNATSAVGTGLEGGAQRIASGSRAVTDRLEGAGRYLQESDPRTMLSDVTGVMRAHPVASIAVGVGLGFLIGRMLSR